LEGKQAANPSKEKTMTSMYRIKKDGKYWTGYNWAPTQISAESYCDKWEASCELKKVGGEIEKFSFCNG
jgi:hypothetical protein